MKPIVALSTSWCSHRHEDGYAMLQEMAGLGFEHVELSHGIKVGLVPGILRAVEEGVVKITSTHNFCPLPIGVSRAAPNLFEPSAPERREREQWLHHTRRSIEFAARVKARALVCHLGRVRFFWFNPARVVEAALRRRGDAAPLARDYGRYKSVLRRAQARLRARLPAFWERAKACVLEVVPFARQHGVKLALENREGFDELPLDEDFAAFLAELPGETAGYWHDAGHAQLKAQMGVLDCSEHLARLSARAIGFHLHDVDAAGRDHQALGDGSIDFGKLSAFWRPEQLLTIELSPRVSKEGVHVSRTRVEALLTHLP